MAPLRKTQFSMVPKLLWNHIWILYNQRGIFFTFSQFEAVSNSTPEKIVPLQKKIWILYSFELKKFKTICCVSYIEFRWDYITFWPHYILCVLGAVLFRESTKKEPYFLIYNMSHEVIWKWILHSVCSTVKSGWHARYIAARNSI